MHVILAKLKALKEYLILPTYVEPYWHRIQYEDKNLFGCEVCPVITLYL